jgi:protein ImuA
VGQLIAIDTLLADRRIWRGQPAVALSVPKQPTGHAALDAVLPWGGWPEASLTELLLPADGIGELRLLLPTLARLTRAGRDIAIVAPPYLPYPAGWRQAGVDFAHMHLIDATPRDALWASEQCLRAGCLSAVLSWPMQADDRALRRLQVAADTGGVMGFVFRDARAERNPSPATLRIAIDSGASGERPAQLRVLKCRGAVAPARPVPFSSAAIAA